MFVIRGLRKEGYGQKDVDLLFKSIVLSKLTQGLSIYGASKADLVVMSCFLKRCHKRRYISDKLSIYDLLERSDRKLYDKIREDGKPSVIFYLTDFKGLFSKASKKDISATFS